MIIARTLAVVISIFILTATAISLTREIPDIHSITQCHDAQNRLEALRSITDERLRKVVLDTLDHRFAVTLLLKPNNEDVISEIFTRVSTPTFALTEEARNQLRNQYQSHELLNKVRGYGQYLTLDELAQVSGPPQVVLEAVESWLRKHFEVKPDSHIPNSADRANTQAFLKSLEDRKIIRRPWSGDRSVLQLSLTYDQIEAMFQNVSIDIWFDSNSHLARVLDSVDALEHSTNTDQRLLLLRTQLLRTHLEADLRDNSVLLGYLGSTQPRLHGLSQAAQQAIGFVHGLKPKFRSYLRQVYPRSSSHPVQNMDSDDPQWSPQTLCKFLGFSANRYTQDTTNTALRAKNITAQSVLGTLHQTYTDSDVAAFVEKYGLPKSARVIRGGDSDADASNGNEAELDVQWILATSVGCTGGRSVFPTYFLYFDGYSAFLDWIAYVASNAEVGQVHSASFDDIEYSEDPAYRNQLNLEFKKAGTRGLTILVASGDDGTGCKGNGGRACNSFAPEFPASSPYITSVGGTTLVEPYNDEVLRQSGNVYGSYASGGGFSTVFPRTDYQKTAVENYFTLAKQQNKLPSQSYFNGTGRGYPDLAAPIQYYPTFINGNLRPQAGTSGAAPVVAGLLTLLNEARATQGRPALGFFNPLAYAIASREPKAFTDAIGGRNDGNPIDGSCSADDCGKGFTALEGWDPVTGLGVPQFDILREQALREDVFV